MRSTATTLRVGDLAKKTGITVRTLHWYEQVGLLSPSQRSQSGYRLYSEADVARLQRIRSLRDLGFSLSEIRDCLDNPAFSLARVIDLQLARLRDRIEQERMLAKRLEALGATITRMEEVSTEQLLQIMELMNMHDTYYTPEQQTYLKQRADRLGQEHIAAAEAEWRQLIAAVRARMDAGVGPADASVQTLAKRWRELIADFTGGNQGVEQSLGKMWQGEPSLHEQSGIDPAMIAYVGKALAATPSQEQ